MVLSAHTKIPIYTVNAEESRPLSLSSYDDILGLIDDLEYGELENRCSLAELDNITAFLAGLAKQGMLSDQFQEIYDLEQDLVAIAKAKDNPYYFAFDLQDDFAIHPAIYYGNEQFIRCNWFSKQWRQAKNFVQKHKKAIIIGAVIIVAVATIYGIAVATSTAGAGAATAAAGSSGGSHSSSSQSDNNYTAPPQNLSSSLPEAFSASIQPILTDQINSFKDYLHTDPFFPAIDSPVPYGDFSLGEHGRILGSLFAHESLKNLEIELPNQPLPAFGHQEVDKSFATDYTPIIANSEKGEFQTLLYQTRGEKALNAGFWDLALHDFGKVIELNPTTPIPYLERGKAFFEAGNFENSIQDYYHYTTLAQTNSFSIPEFVLSFSSSIPKGVYDSGEGMFLFFSDFIKHPIQTGQQIWDAFSTLNELAHNEQWEVLSEVLAPEVYQLVKDWDTLSSQEKGELAGYAFGKHGSDIITPGAVTKIISKGFKGAQELGSILQRFQTAEKTLLLESLAECGNTAKFAEVIQSTRTTIALGEDLGFSYKQMAALKEAGTLDRTVLGVFDRVQKDHFWKRSYQIIKNAEDFLKPYCKQYIPEKRVRELIHQTGVRTYPRPHGIPENYRVQISKDGAGMIYMHPEHNHTSIRVMPGKPHSYNPCQREPYVIQMKNGKAIDIFGNRIDPSLPEAHIPLKHFKYKN
jgi:hypothetical protein